MHFPTWVDLKGQDSVPDTVHHVVGTVDPKSDRAWQHGINRPIITDGVHHKDNRGDFSKGIWSQTLALIV